MSIRQHIHYGTQRLTLYAYAALCPLRRDQKDDEYVTNDIFIGGGGRDYATQQFLSLGYANRHGLIAGATGTGKTVTLQILAEGFSAQGVPVFLSDVKGDLSGLANAGSDDSQAARSLYGARRENRL